MWVRNLSKFPITLFKAEKIVVLKPGCIADVDLPTDSAVRKNLEAVKTFDAPKKDVVVGSPTPISSASNKRSATPKKCGKRNAIR